MSDGCNDTAICEQVQQLYTELALHPEKGFAWGKGKENARALGYDETWLELLPEAVWESTAAVGNPFAIGSIDAGETVLDLGCGAGADVCVAALLVGPRGRVIGVDFTPAMVEKARANSKLAGLSNVTMHEADIANLPLPDAYVDVVISHGAINLSPHKPVYWRKPSACSNLADVSTSLIWCATHLQRRGNARQSRRTSHGPTAWRARLPRLVSCKCSRRSALWTLKLSPPPGIAPLRRP